jgi:hypothetical protein
VVRKKKLSTVPTALAKRLADLTGHAGPIPDRGLSQQALQSTAPHGGKGHPSQANMPGNQQAKAGEDHPRGPHGAGKGGRTTRAARLPSNQGGPQSDGQMFKQVSHFSFYPQPINRSA